MVEGMEPEHLLAVRASLIRTLDPERPEVECLALRGGRVAASGTVEEVRSWVGGSAEWLDLRPAVVLPGLTDSHIHLLEWAVARRRPDLSDARSMAEALERVAAVARAQPVDAWLEFKGWNPAWRSQARLADLDAVSAGRAVALIAHDLHSGWLNSEAMRRLAIGLERRDPPGGSLERGSQGELTGVLLEQALDWWYEGRPRLSDAARRAAVLEGQAVLHRLGVTAVHSVEAPGVPAPAGFGACWGPSPACAASLAPALP